MIPTFVIGLREGVEAALIVGIVAAFLRKQEQRQALRWVWIGVAVAVTFCLAVGAGCRSPTSSFRSVSRNSSRPSSPWRPSASSRS